MENLGHDVLLWALGLVGTIITTIVLPYLIKLLQSKTKNEKLQYVIKELGDSVITSVSYVNQTFVEQLKADGKFDAENQKKAMQMALDYTVATLTDTAKKIISSEGIDLNSLIQKYIEAAINGQKQ